MWAEHLRGFAGDLLVGVLSLSIVGALGALGAISFWILAHHFGVLGAPARVRKKRPF